MKIAINASILDDRPSGLGVYTLNVINYLCQIIEKSDQLIIYTSVPQYFTEQSNIKVKKIPDMTQPKYGKQAAIYRFIWTNTSLLNYLKKEEVDLLYSTTHHGPLFYKNQIITIHDLLPIHFNYKDSLQRILQTNYFKFVLPQIIGRAKKIITISDCTKSDIIKYFNVQEEKIVKIYNGYDKNLFFPRNNARSYIYGKYKIEDYILAVGASYPHKNYDNLIKAITLTLDKNIKLIIAGGKDEYRNYLKKLAKELNLVDKVLFINYVPQEDLPYLYSAAKCLVYPSLYEGFGLPPLEAMACGCPVITSNTSSLPEVVGDAGIMVNPHSIEELAKAIDLVLSNENLRKEMIEKGLKRAKKFSWEKTAEETLKVYEEVYKEAFGGKS
ncbi:glycosyl transferase group 1 [Thermoanaerobacter italicus Ab9]|uniref:Glycosyl transferase group 1 n=1 Tax=Thermoanaerobacter italicus (strain DSM 9252 / Ab9) TaxID=580331 RepID=D3T7L2_THEIA|nr:glycosyltransferase family 1 protein [Thermoanaerobacter italicus]ADD01944.1 glycosyl transferase group 1 [Thermoanaerobacter italicus Ab9]KUJ90233.1 MAG: group 1 glycosyl transferase [Thermoanaerobacter thermocopriae]